MSTRRVSSRPRGRPSFSHSIPEEKDVPTLTSVSDDDDGGDDGQQRVRKRTFRSSRRTWTQQLRWYLLRANSRLLLLQAAAILSVGWSSFAIGRRSLQWALNTVNQQQPQPQPQQPRQQQQPHPSLLQQLQKPMEKLQQQQDDDRRYPSSVVQPRVLGYFYDHQDHGNTVQIQRLSPAASDQSRGQHRDIHNHILPFPPYGRRRVEPMSPPKEYNRILQASEDYAENKPHALRPAQEEHCHPQYDWQVQSYPVCNILHENTMAGDRLGQAPQTTADEEQPVQRHPHNGRPLGRHRGHPHYSSLRRQLSTTSGTTPHQQGSSSMVAQTVTRKFPRQNYHLVGHGHWRDTWMANINNGNDVVAFKTSRYHHDTSEYLVDKTNRDAITSDRLTASPHTIQLHAYCGTSTMTEYAPGGDLYTYLLQNPEVAKELKAAGKPYDPHYPPAWQRYYSSQQRWQVAVNATQALVALHHAGDDKDKVAIVHSDFNYMQFVAIEEPDQGNADDAKHLMPEFKLGDFNLARMVYWNTKANHPCTIEPESSEGTYRAPEEYGHKTGLTDKVDIFSLGTLLYTILTGRDAFDDMETDEEVMEAIRLGKRPHIDDEVQQQRQDDLYIRVMMEALEHCWVQDPHQRPSARQVEQLLLQAAADNSVL